MAKAKAVLPTCLAFAICDTVIEDALTRNKSLINMFNGILAENVPAIHDKLCVFVALTGARGQVPVRLRLCYDPEYEKDLLAGFGIDHMVQFPANQPQTVIDMVFVIRLLRFPHFGSYTFEILCEDVPLIARRFSVQRPPVAGMPMVPPPPAPPDPAS